MLSVKQTPTPIKVFISYSQSDTDKRWRVELLKHLKLMSNDYLIQVWDDQRLAPGTDWESVLKDQLNSAELILALVSIDFLTSDYIRRVEMKIALERHQRREAVLLPIILSQCEWQHSPLAGIQVLPHRAKPVTSWEDPAEAFLNIAEGIREIAHTIQQKLMSPDAELQTTKSSRLLTAEAAFRTAAIQSGVAARQYRVDHVIGDEGHVDITYSVFDLIASNTNPAQSYVFQTSSLTGILSGPELSQSSRSLGCLWKPKTAAGKITMEKRIRSKSRTEGEVRFRPLLREQPISFGWKLHVEYGAALSNFDFFQMYTKGERKNVDGTDLTQPTEYFLIGVTYPVEQLTLSLVLPKAITVQPQLQVFRTSGSAASSIQKLANSVKICGSPSPKSKWEVSHESRPHVIRGEGPAEWQVTIPYPPVGAGYSLIWDLPKLDVRTGRLDVQARQVREALIAAHLTEPSGAVLRAVDDAVKALYDSLAPRYKGKRKAKFDVSFMTFDDETKRLIILKGLRDGEPFPQIYEEFRLPVGMGTAGTAYKRGQPVLYAAPEAHEKGPAPYVSGGESDHGALLSVPIDHPEFRSSNINRTLTRRIQVIGIVNIGTDDSGSPLRDLPGVGSAPDKEDEASALQELCQSAFDPLLKQIGQN